MFSNSSIIVGLEIGTSKICAVVGEVNDEGNLNVVGVGQSPSRGVRKGEIMDFRHVEDEVRAAIVEAEKMADVEIRSVYLGVTGGHIRGFNNRGVQQVLSSEHEITEADMQDVVKNAKAINLPANHAVLHAVRQNFLVDGQEGITNPVGMLGQRLEVDMHVIHGAFTRVQNPIRIVKGLQLEVDEVVFNGMASSLALLTPEQKEMGAVVIDLGGGTTDFVAYVDGVLRHSGVLAVGGDHISQDLSVGLKVPLSRAESLKLEHGGAFVDDAVKGRVLPLANEVGLPFKEVNVEHLRRIMALRLEEIFELVAKDLEKADVLNYVRAGVFLCGGVSRVPQLAQLAELAFQLPVTVGRTNSINGLKSALDQPEFAAAIGLVKYGSMKQRRREEPAGRGFKGIIKNLLQRTNLL